MESSNIYEKVLKLKELLIEAATGNSRDLSNYSSLRTELLTDPETKTLLPASVRQSRTTEEFRRKMQAISGQWAPRREFIDSEFAPIFDQLEGLGSNMARTVEERKPGNKVFIGHGGSSVWRDLKDFLKDRLNLRVEEFNSSSTAGMSTIERLSEMLDSSTFAFLIMTGEDETSDGKLQARLNVVHEIGLFQGRLGFRRAIVLLEEGCSEFSNIHGLTQIRFPKGNIKAMSEEIRRVLEREGLLEESPQLATSR